MNQVAQSVQELLEKKYSHLTSTLSYHNSRTGCRRNRIFAPIRHQFTHGYYDIALGKELRHILYITDIHLKTRLVERMRCGFLLELEVENFII